MRDWEPTNLRKHIGVVLQQSTLFAGTVSENIAYGRPDAPLQEVIAAAQAAQAHDFIMRMPDGYDSIVEARGATLSGGQRQRIAIARALLTKPAVLILDDSTSSVDLDTELRLQLALKETMAHTTTFVVAQRISSVVDADLILVLRRRQDRRPGYTRGTPGRQRNLSGDLLFPVRRGMNRDVNFNSLRVHSLSK